ncbi:DUF6436 domain-containing protein [Idiomarina aminovorans]|uniref:DUF6436 domain-containing protein n=1 Tax=Idiomarina aminovorans TaxID=2914829 RepID=UPI00200299F7|nr:DUF6436 domain-containing protein [Idiomarina sp. ATCH4]MCK7458310.1 DUF6436 domain-containing protein [Idiomarina sp. ATCH4]
MTKKLSKARARWLLVAVIAWFGLVLWGINYLLEQRLVWFDEQGQLLELSNNDKLEHELVQQLSHLGYSVSGQVFHIMSQDCSCNWRSSAHIAKVKRQITEADGQNLLIDIDQASSLKSFVPATPAIIMFNKSSELIYIGPYADGAFCNAESSFVEALIPSVSMSSKAPEWVNTVAKGCYCKV